ncbi:MAG: GNAT family N-acetyltransferase [Erysipelotrichaceae bacterium]|nr:GNAT family N-acetyltransferase [Erysipelotrichaceae bacterium]
MKLCRASATDKAILYQQWKAAFAHDDGGSIDHYFNALYDPMECYLLKENDSILCSLQVHRHTMNLHGKRVSVSYIVGVLTPPEHRRKGYMKRLMDEVLDMLSHQDLITVLQAYNPSLYEPFGFARVYKRKRIWVDKSMVPSLSSQGISYNADPGELTAFYKEFTKHFDGWFVREGDYYEKRFAELRAEGASILTLKEDGVLKGYCMFSINGRHADIQEILYLDTLSLLKMISALLMGKEKVVLHVSQHENLTRVLPGSTESEEDYMSVRINDYDLFNKLFDTRVNSPLQAMTMGQKPLWISDSQ